MEFEFTYTLEDIREAVTLRWPNSSKKNQIIRISLSLFFIIIVIWQIERFGVRNLKQDFLPGLTGGPPIITFFLNIAPVGFPLIFVIYIVFSMVWKKSHRGLAAWKSNPSLQQPQTIKLDSTGVKSSSSLGESLIHWRAIRYWKETPNLLALRLSSKGTLVLPKRVATPEQLEQLRKLFAGNVLPPAKGFPVTTAPN
jgi:hypothetical protein